MAAIVMAIFDSKQWFVGVGGRLGYAAQIACTTQFLLSSIIRAPSEAAAVVGVEPLPYFRMIFGLPVVAGFTAFGALFMRFWKYLMATKSAQLSNSVGAVGATGLLASMLLPASLAGPVFCGSFVAMSSPAVLPTTKSLICASFLAGAAQQSLAGMFLGGWGGKLGTASLMGVLSYATFFGASNKDMSSPAEPQQETMASVNTLPQVQPIQEDVPEMDTQQPTESHDQGMEKPSLQQGQEQEPEPEPEDISFNQETSLDTQQTAEYDEESMSDGEELDLDDTPDDQVTAPAAESSQQREKDESDSDDA